MIEVTIVKIEADMSTNQFARLMDYVSLDKARKIRKLHFFSDAQNALIGELLVRTEISRITGISNSQITFDYNEYGKPSFINHPYVQFNISHTAGYVACALDDEPVGIDVEVKETIDIRIAERFYSSDELAAILTLEQEMQKDKFYEIWAKKESRIKWEGKGLSKSLPSFSVLSVRENPRLYYHKIIENEKIVGYVCSGKKVPPIIKHLIVPEALNYFELYR